VDGKPGNGVAPPWFVAAQQPGSRLDKTVQPCAGGVRACRCCGVDSL